MTSPVVRTFLSEPYLFVPPKLPGFPPPDAVAYNVLASAARFTHTEYARDERWQRLSITPCRPVFRSGPSRKYGSTPSPAENESPNATYLNGSASDRNAAPKDGAATTSTTRIADAAPALARLAMVIWWRGKGRSSTPASSGAPAGCAVRRRCSARAGRLSARNWAAEGADVAPDERLPSGQRRT